MKGECLFSMKCLLSLKTKNYLLSLKKKNYLLSLKKKNYLLSLKTKNPPLSLKKKNSHQLEEERRCSAHSSSTHNTTATQITSMLDTGDMPYPGERYSPFSSRFSSLKKYASPSLPTRIFCSTTVSFTRIVTMRFPEALDRI